MSISQLSLIFAKSFNENIQQINYIKIIISYCLLFNIDNSLDLKYYLYSKKFFIYIIMFFNERNECAL